MVWGGTISFPVHTDHLCLGCLLSLSRSMTYHHWNEKQDLWLLPTDDKFGFTSNWSSVDLHLLRHYKKIASDCSTDLSYSNSRDYLHRGMKWAVGTLGDNLAMMKHLFRCMESLPSVVDTLVPNAHNVIPPVIWPHDRSRDYVYMVVLWRWGYDSDLLHFCIEIALRCLEAEISDSTLTIWVYDLIHRIHTVPNVNGLPELPHGQCHFMVPQTIANSS